MEYAILHSIHKDRRTININGRMVYNFYTLPGQLLLVAGAGTIPTAKTDAYTAANPCR